AAVVRAIPPVRVPMPTVLAARPRRVASVRPLAVSHPRRGVSVLRRAASAPRHVASVRPLVVFLLRRVVWPRPVDDALHRDRVASPPAAAAECLDTSNAPNRPATPTPVRVRDGIAALFIRLDRNVFPSLQVVQR